MGSARALAAPPYAALDEGLLPASLCREVTDHFRAGGHGRQTKIGQAMRRSPSEGGFVAGEFEPQEGSRTPLTPSRRGFLTTGCRSQREKDAFFVLDMRATATRWQ